MLLVKGIDLRVRTPSPCKIGKDIEAGIPVWRLGMYRQIGAGTGLPGGGPDNLSVTFPSLGEEHAACFRIVGKTLSVHDPYPGKLRIIRVRYKNGFFFLFFPVPYFFAIRVFLGGRKLTGY